MTAVTEHAASGGALRSAMAAGAVAYIDAEWIPADGSGDLAALVVAADGTVRFGDVWEAQPPTGLARRVAAGRVLAAVAEAAVASARRYAPPGPIHVTGRGAVAACVARLLPERGGGRPAAIIDTTGDPSVLGRSIAALDDLGVLVLAGVAPRAPMSINLYPDVHVRGLRVIGGGPSCLQARAAVTSTTGEALPALLAHEPPDLHECPATSPRSGWYCLAAARP